MRRACSGKNISYQSMGKDEANYEANYEGQLYRLRSMSLNIMEGVVNRA